MNLEISRRDGRCHNANQNLVGTADSRNRPLEEAERNCSSGLTSRQADGKADRRSDKRTGGCNNASQNLTKPFLRSQNNFRHIVLLLFLSLLPDFTHMSSSNLSTSGPPLLIMVKARMLLTSPVGMRGDRAKCAYRKRETLGRIWRDIRIHYLHLRKFVIKPTRHFVP